MSIEMNKTAGLSMVISIQDHIPAHPGSQAPPSLGAEGGGSQAGRRVVEGKAPLQTQKPSRGWSGAVAFEKNPRGARRSNVVDEAAWPADHFSSGLVRRFRGGWPLR